MNPDPRRGEEKRAYNLMQAAGAAAFALCFFLFAFQPGVLRSDDFGYLRSIIGTLRRGHPYTYEWLAPYGAVTSSLCAALYRLTGNFYLSTYGFQAFCAAAVFFLLHRLLAERLRPAPAMGLTLAFLTFPVCFAKIADFHGSIGTLALFLTALLAFEAGSLPGFFLAAFLAFANRQSHLALLMLPAWSLGAEFWNRSASGNRDLLTAVDGSRSGTVDPDRGKSPFAGWPALAGAAAFAALALALQLGMNRTYAMRNAVFTGAGNGRILSVTLALGFGCLATLACLALAGAVFRSPGASLKANFRRPWLPLAATALVLAMARAWPPNLLMIDTPMFARVGWPQANAAAPWILAVCAWLLDYRLLRPSPRLAVAGGFILIACLRGVWWDYYFLEIMALSLLVAVDRAREDKAAIAKASWSPGGRMAIAVLLSANLAYAYLLRIQMDKQKLSVTVMEGLERQGRATVDEMTGATFGYLGWKLFDYFLAHEGRAYGELADFMGYVRRDRIVIETGVPWRRGYKRALPPGAVPLDSGTACIGFLRLPYRVTDLRGPDSARSVMGRPMRLDPARFRSPRFPLDNREWRALLDSLAVAPLDQP